MKNGWWASLPRRSARAVTPPLRWRRFRTCPAHHAGRPACRLLFVRLTCLLFCIFSVPLVDHRLDGDFVRGGL